MTKDDAPDAAEVRVVEVRTAVNRPLPAPGSERKYPPPNSFFGPSFYPGNLTDANAIIERLDEEVLRLEAELNNVGGWRTIWFIVALPTLWAIAKGVFMMLHR